MFERLVRHVDVVGSRQHDDGSVEITNPRSRREVRIPARRQARDRRARPRGDARPGQPRLVRHSRPAQRDSEPRFRMRSVVSRIRIVVIDNQDGSAISARAGTCAPLPGGPLDCVSSAVSTNDLDHVRPTDPVSVNARHASDGCRRHRHAPCDPDHEQDQRPDGEANCQRGHTPEYPDENAQRKRLRGQRSNRLSVGEDGDRRLSAIRRQLAGSALSRKTASGVRPLGTTYALVGVSGKRRDTVPLSIIDRRRNRHT